MQQLDQSKLSSGGSPNFAFPERDSWQLTSWQTGPAVAEMLLMSYLVNGQQKAPAHSHSWPPIAEHIWQADKVIA